MLLTHLQANLCHQLGVNDGKRLLTSADYPIGWSLHHVSPTMTRCRPRLENRNEVSYASYSVSHHAVRGTSTLCRNEGANMYIRFRDLA